MWSDNDSVTDDEQDQRPLYVSNAHDPRLSELSIESTTEMDKAIARLGVSHPGYEEERSVLLYAAKMYILHGNKWAVGSPILAEHRPMLAGIERARLRIGLCYVAIVQASSDVLSVAQ